MAKQDIRTDVQNSVETAKHAISDGVRNGMDAVRSEAGEIKAMAAHGADVVSDAVTQGIKSAAAEKDVILDAARQQGDALQKLIAAELKNHPIRSLGIAAAIGLMAGYLSSR
jgi:ElaB/YqjD/DUF883 family membrane-anchored ribosome-binding protein